MRHAHKTLFARTVSMEDADVNEIGGTSTEVIELDPIAETLADEIVEVVEADAEIAVDEALIEKSVDAVVALEGLRISLANIAAKGGLDRTAAGLIQGHKAQIMSGLGYSSADSRRSSVSMESFDSFGGRTNGTYAVMEEFKDTAADIWNRINEMVKKLIATMVGFYKRLFDANTKLAARADKVKAAAEAFEGDNSGVKVTAEGLVKQVMVSTGAANVPKAAVDLLNLVKELTGNYAATAAAGGEAVVKAFEGAANKEYDKAITEATAGIATIVKTPQGFSEVQNAADYGTPEGLKAFRSAELPGNRAVLYFSGDAGNTEAMLKAGARVGEFAPGAQLATELPALTKAAAVELASTVKTLIEVLQGAQSNNETSTKLKERLSAAAGKIAGGADEAGKEALTYLQRLAAGFGSKIDQPYVGLSEVSLRAGKALLDYVELSIAGKKEAAPAPAEKPAEQPAAA